MLRSGPAPRLGFDQLVVHVCRWDRIKDPIGVMRGFVEHTLPHAQAHLILAGPTVHTVTDDPEEPETLDEVEAAWRALPHEQRARVTVACLPMHDVDENAAIVNALQRHADVIVKKSLEQAVAKTLGDVDRLRDRVEPLSGRTVRTACQNGLLCRAYAADWSSRGLRQEASDHDDGRAGGVQHAGGV